jgi:hypothetical protein
MSSHQRYATILSLVLPLSFAVPSTLMGQEPPQTPPQVQQQAAAAPEINDERLAVYVRAFMAERRVQDEFDPLLAAVRNKQHEIQDELRVQRREAMLKVYTDHGLTEEEFNWITFVVSSNQERREAFERMLEAAKSGEPQTP